MNTYSEDLEHEATTAHCPKCGDEVKGSEDGLCGACSGEEPEFTPEEIEEAEGINSYGIRN